MDLIEDGDLILTNFDTVQINLIYLVVPVVTLDIVEFVPLGGINHQETLDHVFASLLNIARHDVVQMENLLVEFVGVWVFEW